MVLSDTHGSWCWRAALVLGIAALLLVSWHQLADRPANAAGSTPDLAMSIDVSGGGDDCDTRASTGGIGTTCNVGSTFTVKGHVDSFTGISGTGGYGGIRFRFNDGAGLAIINRAAVTELGPSGTPYWPDCATPSETKPADSYQAECHTAGPTSSFLGKVVEVDYACVTAGSHTLTMEDANTYLFNSGHFADNSDKEGNETLTINCSGAGVGGLAEAPEIAGLPLEEPEPSGTNAGLVAGAAAVIVGVVTMSGAAWYVRRRRAD